MKGERENQREAKINSERRRNEISVKIEIERKKEMKISAKRKIKK
jgi:hypothetical protein